VQSSSLLGLGHSIYALVIKHGNGKSTIIWFDDFPVKTVQFKSYVGDFWPSYIVLPESSSGCVKVHVADICFWTVWIKLLRTIHTSYGIQRGTCWTLKHKGEQCKDMQRELLGGFKHFDVSSLGFPDVYTIIPKKGEKQFPTNFMIYFSNVFHLFGDDYMGVS